MNDYKVVIAGGRDFSDYILLENVINYYLSRKVHTHNVIIISGHARGADKLGERYANNHNLQLEIYSADWKKNGKAAGYIRNGEMADVADALIAFWNGYSKGTANMINLAKKKGIKVVVIKY